MPKLYKYTLYRQDGIIEEYEPCPRKDFTEIYKLLDCETIQILPSEYYAHQKWGRCYVYVDEEGRFDSDNYQNPFFKELEPGWDVVGNALKEEVCHE